MLLYGCTYTNTTNTTAPTSGNTNRICTKTTVYSYFQDNTTEYRQSTYPSNYRNPLHKSSTPSLWCIMLKKLMYPLPAPEHVLSSSSKASAKFGLHIWRAICRVSSIKTRAQHRVSRRSLHRPATSCWSTVQSSSNCLRN